jgi:mono/diheme cytochrome c family protein
VRPSPLLAIVATALVGCAYGYPDPMAKQEKQQAYRPSELFPDGRAMQPPPPHTVPRERPRGSREFLTGMDDRGPVETIPTPMTRELLAVGRHDFDVYCAACHGRLGDGNSPVARSMSLRVPPSIIAKRYPPGKVFRIVTLGWGMMPAYAADIPVEERWGVVAYLEALRHSQNARLEDAPPEVRAQLSKEGGP